VSAPEQQPAAEEASLIGSSLDDRYRMLEVIDEGGLRRVYRGGRHQRRQRAHWIRRAIRRG
jgi:hypothetical protein